MASFVVIGISSVDPSQDTIWGPFPSPWEASEFIEYMTEVGMASDFAEVTAAAMNAPEQVVTPVPAGLDMALC